MSYKFTVSEHHDGRRLDKVIRSLWPALPSGAFMKNIRKGLVRIDGRKAKCSTLLTEGQEIYVPWEEPPARNDQGTRKELESIYRDEFIWIVNKPSDLLSQPSVKGEDSVLSRSWADTSLLHKDFRPALVNRLDRNTSGMIILALNGSALRELQNALREGRIKKGYLALVCGEIPENGRINEPLLKDPVDNMVRVDPAGRPAITLFRRVFSDGTFSLVELELVTGRPHQARVHLAHAGYPVLGDRKYGNEIENRYWWKHGVKRPLLHAFELSFSGMVGNMAVLSTRKFRSPLPEDMLLFFQRRSWKELSIF